ncbi:MAG: DUF354 domain-containing protein [Bacteroidales bacterium]|jgi:predicted glycosyltransferase|nr:DUF354 domain-containing protein [Bacteroidales bacterium]
MKILIDIGHPGHVHYFKNAIKQWKNNGHKVLITARNKKIIKKLLNIYNLPFINRGKGKNSKLGKLIYMLWADFVLIIVSLKFKPDIYLSFSSPYAAQVSFLFKKPHIALNDTEHTDLMHSKFTYPFTKYILTPKTYQNDLGKKQIRFNNVADGFYLHEKYFTPNPDSLLQLKLKKDERFAIVRFVSWNAHHDYGQSGLSIQTKRALIVLLQKKYKVFISSEDDLDKEFEKYQINISPEKMHDVLYYASIFVGESGTMASESSFLGTPTVYINSLPLMCYLKLEQEFGILKHFSSSDGVIDYVKSLLKQENLKEKTRKKALKMKESFINPTEFLVWFIENFPESVSIMNENPDYQYNFR